MARITSYQRMIRTGQPYTRIVVDAVPHIEATPDGPTLRVEKTHQVYGYTLEEKLVPTEDDTADPEWALTWGQHDLGAAAALEDADSLAADWRGSLVGQFPIR